MHLHAANSQGPACVLLSVGQPVLIEATGSPDRNEEPRDSEVWCSQAW